MDEPNLSREREHREIYSVYLNGTYYEMKISAEAYKQILAIVAANAVCSSCREHYSADNPNVAGLLCLCCFLRGDRKGLTFQGPLDPELGEGRYKSPYAPFEAVTYLFLNKEGHAYLTSAGPGEREETTEDRAITLRYWQFPRPQQAERNGETINVSGYDWWIYGDVVHDDVLIIQHGSKFYKNELLFIVERNGKAIQINRRKPMHRAVLADARTEIEDTRTEGGMYLIDGEYRSYIHDSDVYRLAAKRVGEALSAARADSRPLELEASQEPQEVTE